MKGDGCDGGFLAPKLYLKESFEHGTQETAPFYVV